MIEPMSARDSRDLAEHVRRQERLAKAMVGSRSAELMADFEDQMARIYSFDEQKTWAEAMKAVNEATEIAKAAVAARCEELGIPPQFAPTIRSYWFSRNENAVAERRAELRKVAQTRIEAMGKAAKVEIERGSVEIQTQLLNGRLTSGAAREFLAAMPTAVDLMPRLNIGDLRAQIGVGEKKWREWNTNEDEEDSDE